MAPATPLPPLHRLHDDEVERLLAAGERRRDFIAQFGEAGYRQLSALARRAAGVRSRGPVVYVLPGLLGSRLGTRGRRLDDVLWLDLVEVGASHLARLALPRGARLAALGVVLLNALELKLSLEIAGFDARFHAYDWRRSVADLARELNARIAAERVTGALAVGHSMGGLVARLALAADSSRITRVVQLGAPNGGSFASVLALRGVYPTARKLAALDPRHDAEALARSVFHSLPSLHELLPDPALAPGLDLFDVCAWPDDALRPDRRLLADAAAARARWPAADPRCLHVVGVRQETITSVESSDGEFHYLTTRGGDGTVPLALAAQRGAANWFATENHGGLPNNGKVIAAVIDLLRTGTTDRLPDATPRIRSAPTRAVSEASLRRLAPHKVHWTALSPDARRRILEPEISPEFHGPVASAVLGRGSRSRSVAGAGVSRSEFPSVASEGEPRSLSRPVAGAGEPRSRSRSVVAAGVRRDRRVVPAAERRTLEVRLVHGRLADANAHALVTGVAEGASPVRAVAAIDSRLATVLKGSRELRKTTRRRPFTGSLGQLRMVPVTRGPHLAEFLLLAGLGPRDERAARTPFRAARGVIRRLARAGIEDFATAPFTAGRGVPLAAVVEQQLGGFVAGLLSSDRTGVVRRVTICEADGRRYAALRRAVSKALNGLRDENLQLYVDEGAPSDAATATRISR